MESKFRESARRINLPESSSVADAKCAYIFQDPDNNCGEPYFEENSIKNKELSEIDMNHLTNALNYKKIRRDEGSNSEYRVPSDGVLAQRSFSNDNEISSHKRIVKHTAEKRESNLTERLLYVEAAAEEGPTSPIVVIRKPLAELSMIKASKRSKYPDIKDAEEKENMIDATENEFSISVSNSDSPNSSEKASLGGPILINSPQHYWELLFQRYCDKNSVSLQDFHRLLFDYEQLWQQHLAEEI
jgi:hypothetical protein